MRRDLTATTKKIASLQVVVDKMHMAGHIDKWCLANCDSRKIAELDNVSGSCQEINTCTTRTHFVL